MGKYIKWFLVTPFLVLSILFGFGVMEATNLIVASWSLCFAYLAYKADVNVKTE